MNTNQRFWSLAIVVGLTVGLPRAAVAAPWDRLLTVNRVEADPDKPYTLTDENGPWTIMACSFSGAKALEQARELVLELRSRYKLPAYVYQKTFDYGEDAQGRGLDRYGAPMKMRYRRGSKSQEYAVVVGDYPAVDDPDAQKALAKIKYCRPKCLELDKSKPTTRTLASWRLIASFASPEAEKKGPMGHAFVTTNPLLPKDFYVPPGVDKFVVDINKDNKYSLLDCPGRYTVQVAHFAGNVVLDPKEIQAVENGKRLKSRLEKAGEDAEKLCEALRMKGYESYVLHERYASLVTVGSFDSAGTPRSDGKTEINPQIHTLMKSFGAENTGPLPGHPQGVMQPKTLVGIPFDIQPIPVQVPKRSIGKDYSPGVLGMRLP
jgi:hypothetical protein